MHIEHREPQGLAATIHDDWGGRPQTKRTPNPQIETGSRQRAIGRPLSLAPSLGSVSPIATSVRRAFAKVVEHVASNGGI